MSDVWTLEASEERLEHIRALIEQYTSNSRWAQVVMAQAQADEADSNDEFSGWCCSPDRSKTFVWSAEGQTFASADDGVTWIEQEDITIETDAGAFVAGREPSFAPWFLPVKV